MAIDPGTGVLTFAPSQEGEFPVTVAAADPAGAETRQTFTLSVAANPNRDPRIGSTPRTTVGLGQPYLYLLRVADPDGDPLTVALEAAPVGMTLDPENAVSWQPAATQLGSHTVRVRVTDGQGGEAVQEFAVEVVSAPVNRPPVIVSTPPLGATVGRPLAYDPVADDPDRDPVFWALDNAPAGMSIDPVFGFVRWVPDGDQTGLHTLALTVFDANGGTDTQTCTIRVRGANTAPWFASTPPTRAGTNRPYTYTPRALDPDGDASSMRAATSRQRCARSTSKGI